MAENNQTMIIVILVVVAGCCCMSAGIAAFFYFNDDARAWFKKNILRQDGTEEDGGGGNDEDLEDPNTDFSPEGGAADDGEGAPDTGNKPPDTSGDESKGTTTTTTVEYICSKPWVGLPSGGKCPSGAGNLIRLNKPGSGAASWVSDLLKKRRGEIKDGVVYEVPKCSVGKGNRKMIIATHKDTDAQMIYDVQDKVERGRCVPYCNKKNGALYYPYVPGNKCQKVENSGQNTTLGKFESGMKWDRQDRLVDSIRGIKNRGYTISPNQPCDCAGVKGGVAVWKWGKTPQGKYNCVKFDDKGFVTKMSAPRLDIYNCGTSLK